MQSGTSAASRRSQLQRSAQSNPAYLYISEYEDRSQSSQPNTATSCCLTTTPDYIRGHPRIVDLQKIAGGTGCNPVRAQRAGGLSCSERRRAMPPASTFQNMRIALKPASLLQQDCLLTIRSHGNNLHGFADDFLDCLDISNCIFRQIFHFTNAGNVFLPACNGPIHGF